MKRVLYLVIAIVAAAAFFVFVYPRLSGPTVVTPPASSGNTATPASAGGQGRRGGSSSVVVAVATTQTIPIVKTAVGFMEAVNVAIVRPRADGLVMAVHVVAGQDVKQGDTLFTLDDAAIQAQIAKDNATIAKDQANADFATTDLKRQQALFDKGVVNQQQLDTSTASAKAATAGIAVDQAQLQADQLTLSYLTITAPIAGRVGVVNTSEGNMVHAADISAGGLMSITDMTKLRAAFSVPERDLGDYKAALAGAKALPVTISVPGESTPRATGTLSFLDSSVDTGSGTIIVKADVDNSADVLWPGEYVSVSVETGSYPNVTTVPLVAVQQSSSGPFVFIVGADKKVKRQPVTVVATVADTAIIGTGVQPNDQVVVDGQFGLNEGATVNATLQAQTPPATTTGSGSPKGGTTKTPAAPSQ